MTQPFVDQAKFAAFLAVLSEATRLHGFVICGCGHCGSPYLADMNGTDPAVNSYVDDLRWDANAGRYVLGRLNEPPSWEK